MITLSGDDIRTFAVQPRVITLRGGDQLCRFVTPGQNALHSRFWITQSTLTRFVHQARGAGIPIHDMARQLMGVKKAWSDNMLGLIFLHISSEVQAYAGPAAYQTESMGGNVTRLFTGGAEQIVFPFYHDSPDEMEKEFRRFARLGSYISDIDSLV